MAASGVASEGVPSTWFQAGLCVCVSGQESEPLHGDQQARTGWLRPAPGTGLVGTPADAPDPAGFKALSNWEIIKIIIINWHPDKWRDCLIGAVARELDLTWSLEGKRQ